MHISDPDAHDEHGNEVLCDDVKHREAGGATPEGVLKKLVLDGPEANGHEPSSENDDAAADDGNAYGGGADVQQLTASLVRNPGAQQSRCWGMSAPNHPKFHYVSKAAMLNHAILGIDQQPIWAVPNCPNPHFCVALWCDFPHTQARASLLGMDCSPDPDPIPKPRRWAFGNIHTFRFAGN
eukprot:361935-Chlamydomonas_euryale.AAC.5